MSGAARLQKFEPGQIEKARHRQALVGLVERDGHKLAKHGQEYLGLCPFHDEGTPSFRVYAGDDHFHCFGCGAHGDAIAWRMRKHGESFVEAVESLLGGAIAAAPPAVERAPVRERADRRGEAKALWEASLPLAGTPGEGYFRARGLTLPLPPVLRFHPMLPHGAGADRVRLPGVVAKIEDVGGDLIAVHRIWLDADLVRAGRRGNWCTARRPKKALLASPRGGTVALAGWFAGRVGICEGIETGLAVMQAKPGIASRPAIAAPFLPMVVLPPSVDCPLGLADRDRVSWQKGPMYGQRPGEYWMARACARWIAEGRKPAMAVPPGEECDFLDLLVEAA